MWNTSNQIRPASLLAFVCGAAMAAAANAQVFTLDDIQNTAEDPFAIGLPSMINGCVGPSPSMVAFGYSPGLLLGPRIGQGIPPHVDPPSGEYIDAISDGKRVVDPYNAERGYLEYSVDRVTTGLLGSPVATEATYFQQMGDVFVTCTQILHPAAYVGKLRPGVVPDVPTFGGVLPSAGPGGAHQLKFDESQFGLTTCGEPGLLDPEGVQTPITGAGNKDNLNAWNRDPIDLNGDMVTDVNFFYSISPAEALRVNSSPADIYDEQAGMATTRGIPFATASTMGLDWFGPRSDDVDALVVWDNGLTLGPGWGEGPGAQPLIDFALFSLAPGSRVLEALNEAGVPVSPATIFFTDFTGAFGLYAFESDLGVSPVDVFGGLNGNVDALDFVPICRADLNGDGNLDVFDFLGFQTAFGNGDMAADFSGDGSLDVFDFLWFQTSFGNGC